MTIDEKLFALLSGSPPPAPGVVKWWGNAAGEQTAEPYGVYRLISSPQIQTHDRQNVTRCWRYRISAIGPGYLVVKSAIDTLKNFLIGYTDSPTPGIQRFLILNEAPAYLDKQRLHEVFLDVDIMENIP